MFIKSRVLAGPRCSRVALFTGPLEPLCSACEELSHYTSRKLSQNSFAACSHDRRGTYCIIIMFLFTNYPF